MGNSERDSLNENYVDYTRITFYDAVKLYDTAKNEGKKSRKFALIARILFSLMSTAELNTKHHTTID